MYYSGAQKHGAHFVVLRILFQRTSFTNWRNKWSHRRYAPGFPASKNATISSA